MMGGPDPIQPRSLMQADPDANPTMREFLWVLTLVIGVVLMIGLMH